MVAMSVAWQRPNTCLTSQQEGDVWAESWRQEMESLLMENLGLIPPACQAFDTLDRTILLDKLASYGIVGPA